MCVKANSDGASIAYKKEKIDSIALQCKLLKTKKKYIAYYLSSNGWYLFTSEGGSAETTKTMQPRTA
jgi:hypothetical protein